MIDYSADVPGGFYGKGDMQLRSDLQLRQTTAPGVHQTIAGLTFFISLYFAKGNDSFGSVSVDSAMGVMSVNVGPKMSGGITLAYQGLHTIEYAILYIFTDGAVQMSRNTLGLTLPRVGQSPSFTIQIPNSFNFQGDLPTPDVALEQRLIIQGTSNLTNAIPEPSNFGLAAIVLAGLACKRRNLQQSMCML